MNLALRIFLFAYAAALAAVSAALYLQHNSDSLWPVTGLIALVYFLFACGYTASNDADRAPSRPWIVLAFLFTLLMPTPLLFQIFSQVPAVSSTILNTIVFTVAVFCCLGVALLLLRDFRSQLSHPRLRRILIPMVLISGAALVFLSLRLRITDSTNTGWDVLLFRAPWITTNINVGTPLFFGTKISYLQPFYAYGGYPTYLLALLASAVILIRIAAGQFSLERCRSSRLISRSAVIISLAGLWVLTDIFWGWHFDLHATPWAAALATVLWLAAPLAGAFLLVPVLWQPAATWRLRAFLLLQVPIAAFNVMQLQAYYGSDSLQLQGLGSLIIGLLLESWACLELLAYRGVKDYDLVSQDPEKVIHKLAVKETLVEKAS